MFGSLEASILPTSHVITLVTGSNEYLPWVVVRVTFRTDLGNGISRTMFSTFITTTMQYWHNFLYPLTLPNINRFSKLFHCQNQEKTCNNTIIKDPTTPSSVSLHYLVKYHSISLIMPFISGVACLGVSSSKADTLNIWCKNCRMWQLLQTIIETINTLFPDVNF